jgi:aspartate/methionine/tyrosine aminotransferase
MAGIAALNGPQDAVTGMVSEFRIRRDKFCRALNEIPGFRCVLPEGAFYAFANVKGTGMNSRELADLLLEEAGVACLDGAAFGEYGSGYIRFSYANSLENLEEAARRIHAFSSRWTV